MEAPAIFAARRDSEIEATRGLVHLGTMVVVHNTLIRLGFVGRDTPPQMYTPTEINMSPDQLYFINSKSLEI